MTMLNRLRELFSDSSCDHEYEEHGRSSYGVSRPYPLEIDEDGDPVLGFHEVESVERECVHCGKTVTGYENGDKYRISTTKVTDDE